MSVFGFVAAQLASNFTNATDNALKLQQLINASCTCGGIINGTGTTTFGVSLQVCGPEAGAEP